VQTRSLDPACRRTDTVARGDETWGDEKKKKRKKKRP